MSNRQSTTRALHPAQRGVLTDTGTIPSIGTLCLSPDIITCTAPVADPQAELGDMSDGNLAEDIEHGQDNYVYVRLQNRGAVAGDLTVTLYWSDPSSFSNPSSWHEIGSLLVTDVVPGTPKVAGPIPWHAAQLPPVGHFCIVGQLSDPSDPAPDKGLITTGEQYVQFISRSNNFAWRNINVVDLLPDTTGSFDFTIQGPRAASHGDLVLDMTALPAGSELQIRILRRLCENVGLSGLRFLKSNTRYNQYALTVGKQDVISQIPFLSNDRSEVTVYVKVPPGATGSYSLACIQRFSGQEVSRITTTFNVMAGFEFIGNRRTLEIHKGGCRWLKEMSAKNMVGFHSLDYGHMQGYDNCAFCLGGSKR